MPGYKHGYLALREMYFEGFNKEETTTVQKIS
jgi:hypothetical protein